MRKYLTEEVQSGFVNEVEDAYHRLKMVGQMKEDNLKRGYAKIAAGFFEDAFAEMVFKHIVNSKQYFVLVDWPVECGEGKAIRHKPILNRIDFMLCRKCMDGILEIVYMAELKNNIGYMRNKMNLTKRSIFEDIRKKVDNIKNARERHSRSVTKDSEEKQEFVVAKNLKFDVVVYSSCNSGRINVRQIANKHNHSIKDDAVWIHVLCDLVKGHGQIPCAKDFNCLEKRIRMCMKSPVKLAKKTGDRKRGSASQSP